MGIASNSESRCLTVCAPLFSSADVSPKALNSNSFGYQPNERLLCEDEEPTEILKDAPNKCDMKLENLRSGSNLWKLCCNRVEQILSALNQKEFGQFSRSKKVGIEFNVGFGPKQNFRVVSFNNQVLLELVKFALAINSSQKDFIMEILECNFDLDLQSQRSRNNFACEIIDRVRHLKTCEDSKHRATLSVDSAISPLRSITTLKKCTVAALCPPIPHAEIKNRSLNLFPGCKEMGLKHHGNSQPNTKLKINKLTNGTLLEVLNFAEKLIGTFEKICLDILRHNIALDLQSGDPNLIRDIFAQIPAAVEQNNLSYFVKPHRQTKRKIAEATKKLDCQKKPNQDRGAGSSPAAVVQQNVISFPDSDYKNECNLKLWKLRASQIQWILSVPHKELCPLYSYSRCKKSGIDFNVGSRGNQILDPKLLTNGIMVEFNTFATVLASATKDFITEILE